MRNVLLCLMLITPLSAFADIEDITIGGREDPLQSCLCDCRVNGYQNTPGYYAKPANAACSTLDGQACVATVGGSPRRGTLVMCSAVPRPINPGSLQDLGMSLQDIQQSDPALYDLIVALIEAHQE